MKRIGTWFVGLLNDEKGNPSSKRFVGIVAGISLCIVLFISSFSDGKGEPSEALIDAVALLAFSCLGLASVDKIWSKQRPKDNNEI